MILDCCGPINAWACLTVIDSTGLCAWSISRIPLPPLLGMTNWALPGLGWITLLLGCCISLVLSISVVHPESAMKYGRCEHILLWQLQDRCRNYQFLFLAVEQIIGSYCHVQYTAQSCVLYQLVIQNAEMNFLAASIVFFTLLINIWSAVLPSHCLHML